METKEILHEIEKNFKEIKEKQEEYNGSLDSLKKEQIEKQKDAAKLLLKTEQERQIKEKKITETLETLQESINGVTTEVIKSQKQGSSSKERNKQYDNALTHFLRTKTAIPQDIADTECQSWLEKSFYGHQSKENLLIARKTIMEGVQTEGGALLPADRTSEITTRMYDDSPIRQVAHVVTTTSNRYEKGSIISDMGYEWVGEKQVRPQTSTPQTAVMSYPIWTILLKPTVTEEALDDLGNDLLGDLTTEIADRASRGENNAFVVGIGSGMPRGFTQYPAWASPGTYEFEKVEQITSASSATITSDDIVRFPGRLKNGYRINSRWAMNSNTFFDYILTLKSPNTDRYLINDRLLADGAKPILMGKTIEFFEDLPDVAANSLSVALADWRKFYLIVDRFGIRILRDPYSSDTGEIIFKTTKRVGGGVDNFEAGKIMKIKA